MFTIEQDAVDIWQYSTHNCFENQYSRSLYIFSKFIYTKYFMFCWKSADLSINLLIVKNALLYVIVLPFQRRSKFK